MQAAPSVAAVIIAEASFDGLARRDGSLTCVVRSAGVTAAAVGLFLSAFSLHRWAILLFRGWPVGLR